MAVPYWRLSSFYFFYFASLGCYVPYWSLFLQEKGFNTIEIGQLSALLVGTKIIAPNVWGWIADKNQEHLPTIRWTALLAVMIFVMFLLVRGFEFYAWITVCFSFFWNATLPLFEAATLAHLHADSHRYSKIRLWGSVGFILAVTVLGKQLDFHPTNWVPQAIILLLFITWLTTIATPEVRVGHSDKVNVSVLSILKKPEVIAFILVYVLIQIAHAPYYVFYSIYLKQHLYSTTMTGLLWSLGVVAEIILFLLMNRILKRFSLRTILLSSLALSVLRWILIGSFVGQPWLLIFAQLLHAATFGGAHIAAIHFVQQYFDRQHMGKGQALYHSLSFGLGGMIGSLSSGYCWDVFGSHIIFSTAAVCCALAYLISYIWVGREDNLLKSA
jgi:PPP family 3-phenylpropionic acid transporter